MPEYSRTSKTTFISRAGLATAEDELSASARRSIRSWSSSYSNGPPPRHATPGSSSISRHLLRRLRYHLLRHSDEF
jgi:hypothetical protein